MKKRLLSGLLSLSLILISAFTVLPPFTVASAAHVLSDVENAIGKDFINNGWTFIRTPDESSSGAAISTVGYNDSAYTPAIIPGSALYSYYMAGKLNEHISGDIFYGDNMRILENKTDGNGNSLFNCDYWYRTEVMIPADYSGRRITLNFDGINQSGEVYVNGQSLGSVKGPFTRGSFDITNYVTAGQTAAIAVKAIWSKSTTADTPCFIVLDGWDFSQAVPGRGTGIYKDVYLSSSAYVTVDDPFVYADLPLPNTSSADVKISSQITNHSNTAVTGTITGVINPGNIVFSETVSIPANSTYEFTADEDKFSALHLNNPKLWWPNGMGEQNLYEMSLSFSSGGVVSDGQDVTFGIREFSYDRDPVSDDLLIYINGEKVMCRGGNWGLPDVLFSWGEEEFDTAVKMHKEMGFNMIRTWHGTSDWKEFYEACDKYGILVYEDFWLHGYYVMDLTLSEESQKMFIDNMIDKYKRLRNHACIALWCGENETYPPDYLYKPMEKYYAELDGTRLLIPVSNDDPVSGGIDYAIQEPSWYFGNRAYGFVTEVGAVCIPSYPSLQKMLPPSSLDSISDIIYDNYWQYHDLYESSVGNKHPDWYVNAVTNRYGNLNNSDMEGFAYQAQLVNYETYKAIMEGFNNRMFEGTSGVLLWMSQNTWPSTIWQTYDYYFEATGAYYGCMDACEPLHIQWDSLSGSVKAVNSTAKNYGNLTATAKIYNLDGSLHHTMTKSLQVNKSSLTEYFTIFPKSGEIAGTSLPISSASSSSSNGGDASLAIDGKDDTRWIANSTNNGEYITVDLGSVKEISAVEVNWEAAFASSYDIQVSTNGTSFTTVASAKASGGGRMGTAFATTNARYVRILCKSAGTMWAYSIWEIAVLGNDDIYTGDSTLSSLSFIRLELKDQNGNILSENSYWRAKNNSNYTSLKNLSNVNVNTSASYTQENGSTKLTVTLTNPNNTVAFGAWISAVDSQGNSILPAYYSDNYFFLLPGETRTVTVEYDSFVTPTVKVEGYNINASSVNPSKVGGDDPTDEILGEYENIAPSGKAYDSNTGVTDKNGQVLSAATTSSGYYGDDTGVINVNDGNTTTPWQLGNNTFGTGEIMVGIAFDTKSQIDKLVIQWENASAALENAYSLMYSSDGKNWNTASISISRDNTSDASKAIDTVTLSSAITASFIKIVISDFNPGTDPDNQYKFSPKIFEMEVWGNKYVSSGNSSQPEILVDYSAKALLERTITQFEGFDEEDYTQSSYASLTSAYNSAVSLLDTENSNETQFATAKANFEAAIVGLEYNSNYRLADALSKAYSYALYLYTNASAQALKDAISTAETLIAANSADDTANNNAIAKINSAIANLVALENNIAPSGTVFDSISDGVRDTGSESGYYGNGNGNSHRGALNDQNLNSTWQYSSNSTDNMYCGIKYNEEMLFTKLIIHFENGSRTNEDGYVIETSNDGRNWTATDFTVSRNTNSNPAVDTVTFNGNNAINTVSGKYIRIRITGLATWYAPKFHEISLYGMALSDVDVSADEDIAPSGSAFSNGGNNVGNINDRNSASSWKASNIGNASAPVKVGIKFNEAKNFDTVRIIYNGSAVSSGAVEMQYSTDGNVWRPASKTSITAVNGGFEYSFNTVKAKYFRAYIVQGSNAVTPEIASLEMYCKKSPLAEETVVNSRFGLGAQLRENERNANLYDMRFLLAYSTDEIHNNLDNITEIGTLLVKKNDLKNNELTLELANTANYTVKRVANTYLCNVYTDRYGIYYTTTAITGITDNTCEYTVRGYYIINGRTYYTDTISRCVNDGLGL